jgi:hypothetical protein
MANLLYKPSASEFLKKASAARSKLVLQDYYTMYERINVSILFKLEAETQQVVLRWIAPLSYIRKVRGWLSQLAYQLSGLCSGFIRISDSKAMIAR